MRWRRAGARRRAGVPPAPGERRRALRRGTYPWLWVLPALALVLLFTLYPVAHTLWTSLHRVMILFPGEPFVGLPTTGRCSRAPSSRPRCSTRSWFTLVTAPLIVLLGLGVAQLLLADFHGRFLVRSVVILPWVLPGAISAVLWIWIFHPSWGILNLLLYEAGLIDQLPAVADRPGAGPGLGGGGPRLDAVPVRRRAAHGGADRDRPAALRGRQGRRRRRWQRFRFVTFPQIKAMVVVLLVYNALIAFTSYDLVYAMTAGGPGTATTLLSFQIWKESF